MARNLSNAAASLLPYSTIEAAASERDTSWLERHAI